MILRQRRRGFGSVLRDLVLVTLIGCLIGIALLLILILRLLILSWLLLLGRLLVLGLLLLRGRLLGILLRTLRRISGSRIRRGRVGWGTCRGCNLVNRGGSSRIANRRKVSILRRIHLIAIVFVTTRCQNSQH